MDTNPVLHWTDHAGERQAWPLPKLQEEFKAFLAWRAQQPAASGEPVAEVRMAHESFGFVLLGDLPPDGTRLYATPQPAPARVPLTDQQLCSMRKENLADDDAPAWAYEKGVRDAENAHGITLAQGEPK